MTGPLDTRPPEFDGRTAEAAPGVAPASPPMPVTLSDRRGFAEGWVFGRKPDGIRALAVQEGGTPTARSRSG
ncbi:hypothetical protein GCM10010388_49670 [Streptomyces mauvecolor]